MAPLFCASTLPDNVPERPPKRRVPLPGLAGDFPVWLKKQKQGPPVFAEGPCGLSDLVGRFGLGPNPGCQTPQRPWQR